ncbi:MAG: hypothetical protein Q9186_000847 [Xanthomendoza sp. 1 TL-2023]
MAYLDLAAYSYSIPTATVILLFVFFSKYIYRLTFHPLARFPGPKLAAATNLYGASIDLLTSGSYVKEFPALHEKYGSKFDKDGQFYANPAIAGAFSEDPHRKTALPHRKLLAPGFTREAVRRAESRVVSRVEKFLEKLGGYAETGRPVNLTRGSMCLAADAVMDFAFQKPYDALDAEDFQSDILVPVVDFCKMLQWPMYFPKTFGAVFKITNMLPSWAMERWFKGILTQQAYRQVCNTRVQSLYAQSQSIEENQTPSVFDTAFNPNLEKGQSTPPLSALGADAFVFLLAGTDTTSKTIITGIFALLDASEPHMLVRLKQELREAIPNPRAMASWATLEQLPYLRAFIKESLRLSLGAPGRLPRVVPATGATFCGYDIPPGTIVSSCIYIHNLSPTAFPSPHEFRPERWLGNNTSSLERNLCSFSRGSRICLGMNLATCLLTLTFAHLLRRFDLQLFETTKEDMEWKDCFSPMMRGSLRVKLEGSVEE